MTSLSSISAPWRTTTTASLFQEIDLNKPIVLELTPKEEKVLTEVHDFLFQEVKFPELHDFLFQEITIFGRK